MLDVPIGVLVSLVSVIWLFPIQCGPVLYFSLFLRCLASFLSLGFSHESGESTVILVHSR